MRRTYFAIVASLLVATGCTTTREAPIEGRSGFLHGYYDRMRSGGEDQAQMVYVDPRARFSDYSAVYLAPVKIIRSGTSKLSAYSREELKQLSAKTYNIFREELSKDFTIVKKKDRETMVVEIAISDADKSEPLLDAVSSIVPFGLAASTAKVAMTGKPSFVGEASAEGKISDASGNILMAGMDRRVGGKMISDPLNSWGDFDVITEHWAKRLRYNICQRQGRTACEAP